MPMAHGSLSVVHIVYIVSQTYNCCKKSVQMTALPHWYRTEFLWTHSTGKTGPVFFSCFCFKSKQARKHMGSYSIKSSAWSTHVHMLLEAAVESAVMEICGLY